MNQIPVDFFSPVEMSFESCHYFVIEVWILLRRVEENLGVLILDGLPQVGQLVSFRELS